MYRYKRLLIGLDLSEKDAMVCQYAGLISRMARSEQAHFVHLATDPSIPEAVRREYPELLEPLDERITKQIEKSVQAHFKGDSATQIIVEVLQGKVLDELLRQVREKDIDLVIVGKKGKNKTINKLVEKLARKAPCSVLIVPEIGKAQISKILVAVDFSEYAENALEVSIAFADAANLSEIHCQHVYNVPPGYYKTGKSFEQFAEIMRKNAQSEWQHFISRLPLKGIKVIPEFVLAKDVARALAESVVRANVDLLVLGTQGRSAGAAGLLGSVTEQSIWSNEVPVLAVKKKGAGLSFLDALLKI